MRRRDLAAMIVPLGRALMAAEQPVLRAYDLTMWGYVVLLALGDRPRRTQAALAREIGADKTRIIEDLDDLQDRGLIERRPDPGDRRAHLLSLTPAGRRIRDLAQAAVQGGEERLLARLPAGDREAFLRALQALADVPAEEITGPATGRVTGPAAGPATGRVTGPATGPAGPVTGRVTGPATAAEDRREIDAELPTPGGRRLHFDLDRISRGREQCDWWGRCC
jgi:DNA-binding MarR family transcriptional regulator